MTTIIKKTIYAFALLLPALLLATTSPQTNIQTKSNEKNLAVFYTLEGNIEKKYNNFVENKLRSIGFHLTDPHKRVNDQYETKYGSTVLDVLSFMPVVKDAAILPLLNLDPRIAGFTPFNMLIHKRLDENVTHIGHLMPKIMLDILGIENQEVRAKFSATFRALDATIAQEFGGKKSYMQYKKLPEQKMIKFEYEFEAPEDIGDFIDEFQDKFELAFIDKKYLIAGYHNFMDSSDDAEEILSQYDAFWTYSLGHLESSYHIFDNLGARPEAGLFAPSSIYMYIKKGTNKLIVGMFRLQNWSDTLDIKDAKRLEYIKKLDKQIPQILTDFGMKDISKEKAIVKVAAVEPKVNSVEAKTEEETNNVKAEASTETQTVLNIRTGASIVKITLPTIPTVPSVIQLDGSFSPTTDRSIKFSKRVPPNYIAHRFDHRKKTKVSKNTRIGEVNKGRISTYLRGKFMDVKTIEDKLKTAGFEVLSSTPINKKGTLISVVFTHKNLIKLASKTNRGFIASLRILIDTQDKLISMTNPLYMAKGFLQNDYDEKEAKKILVKLITEFPSLKNSKDTLKFQLLPKYQFMNGMPRYEDMVEVASGSNLLEKIKDNKKVLFTLKLENGSTLIGIQLAKRTNKFIKRIGRNNAAMLPYPILIEDGTAKILDPKYYISFMYPLLTMSEFMTIATIPDAMIKDSEKVFKIKRKK